MQNTAANVVEVVAAVIRRDTQVLIALRPKKAHKGGLWEFPGGKVEPNETQLNALKREIKEEIAIEVFSAKAWKDIRFDYPDKSVHLFFWLVEEFQGSPKGAEGQQVIWADISSLNDYDFPEANQPIVDELMDLDPTV